MPDLPDKLIPGVAYIVGEDGHNWAAGFLCPCGCSEVVQLNLVPLGAASIQYRVAVGPQAGRKVLTLKLAAPAATLSVPKPFTVARDGFSLNATVACAPHQRTDAVRYIDNLLAQPN